MAEADVPTGYNPDDYDRPSVTVDVVVFSLRARQLSVLLVRRKKPPFAGAWAIPGGFVGIDEGLEDAACRELAEETAITDIYPEQLYAFGDPGRDPRMRVITVAYLALLPAGVGDERAGDDAAEARWFPVSDLPELAFDHAEILVCALARLRARVGAIASGYELLPGSFTLAELQAAYELALDEHLERDGFSRRVLEAGILEKIEGGEEPGEARRYQYLAVAGKRHRSCRR